MKSSLTKNEAAAQGEEEHPNILSIAGYAAYLLQNKIEAYTSEIVRLSFEKDLPLLRFFKHLSRAEIAQVSEASQVEFLTYVSEGRVNEHIQKSMQRWQSDQMPLIGKYDVQARDLTLATHVRGQALKALLPSYAKELHDYIQLSHQIDEMLLNYQTASTDVYIQILKDKVTEESHFSSNIIAASPGMTFLYDLVGLQPTYLAGKVLEVTGYSAADLMGAPALLTDSIHPEDMSRVQVFVTALIARQADQTHHIDFRWKTNGGAYCWMRCYAVIYKTDATDSPIQILGVAYDVSREKKTDLELQKRERQLLEAQGITQIGSFEWDIVAEHSVSTPELRKIFEADRRQSLEEMMIRVHPDDQQQVRLALEEAFRTGIYHCQYRYLAPSGEKIIDTRGTVSFDEKQRARTMVGTVQDITQSKQAEERLTQKTIQLEQINERLQQFAFVASHDMKEPLRKIAMFSDRILTLDGDQLPERTQVSFQKIRESSMRMQQLIEGLLSYSSLDTYFHKEMYSLEQAMEAALNSLEWKIKETNARIESDGLPKAKVIPFQMQQLFQNLIGNALKFARPDVTPIVRVTHSTLSKDQVDFRQIQSSEKYLRLQVHDNGIGFSDEMSERIFGLFQRLHGRSEFEGSGIGLAICKKIVEAHGGVIIATGREGEGAVFTIILPA